MSPPALLVAAVITLAPAAALASAIGLTISGARPAGKLFVQVFADPASFKARDKPVMKFSVDPGGAASVRTTFDLPPGRYAIALFQDTKGTGRLETGLLGAPTVPYGFSNNARGGFGPPGFDAAAFDVGAAPREIAIQLR